MRRQKPRTQFGRERQLRKPARNSFPKMPKRLLALLPSAVRLFVASMLDRLRELTGDRNCGSEKLLESLVACAGVTFNVVATAMGIVFRSARVEVEAEGDFRGTLGLAKDVPVGLIDLRLRFDVDTDASDEQLATLLKLTERYCVIFQTLRAPPALSASVRRVEP